MTYTLAPAADVTTLGLPSIGWNVGIVADYETPRFIDRAKQARGFPLALTGVSGHLPVNPPSPPSTVQFYFGSAGVGSFIDASYRSGTFRLTWDGSGQVLTGEAVTNLSGSTSGMTLDYDAETTDAWVIFSNIDWSDPPRNVAMVRTDQIAAHEAGAIFDPDMLALISNAACFRFLDWQITNGSTQENWSDRPLPAYQRWSAELGIGVPLEICIALCNAANVDGWFLIPHLATDDYIANFVQLVHDTLSPNLVARFEYSNELWNTGFGQWGYIQDQAWYDWGPEGWEPADGYDYAGAGFPGSAPLAWAARRSTRMAQIVRSIYGDSRRAVCVFGVHTASVQASTLTAADWQTFDPANYIDPRTLHEEMAITTYFAHNLLRDDANGGYDDEIAAEITANGEAAAVTYALGLVDAEADAHIGTMATLGALAQANGLTLVAYEGNQHIVGYGPALGTGYSQPSAEALSFTNTLNYSAGMAAIHDKILDGFRAAGGTLCCMYKDISPHAAFGSWGLRRYRTDTNPCWTAVQDWNAANPRWWL